MVSLFALGNMAAVFAVPILSDRIGLRRPFLWAFAGVSAVVVVSLMVTPPAAAWVILPILGFAAAGPFAMGFLLGQVMRETKGRANPAVATTLLRQKLGAASGQTAPR